VEWGDKRREVVYFFQYTRHGKRQGIERSNTQENTSAQMTCRVPRPRSTKCTKTSLGFLAVRLSPQEPKRCYGLKGTSIQGLKHDRTKEGRDVRITFLRSTRHSKDENQRNGIKRAINTEQAKGSTHILLDRRGLRTREKEEWNPHSFNQLIMERMKVGRSRHDSPIQTYS
jgi:hypothetical protein